MERRILLAFTLSFLAFVLYMRLRAPAPPDIPLETPEAPQATQPDSVTQHPVAPNAERATPDSGAVVEQERREDQVERDVLVETPFYRAVLTNRGARLTSFLLNEYKDEEGNQYEMVPQEGARRLDTHPLDILLDDTSLTSNVKTALFEVSRESLRLGHGEQGEMLFSYADGRGLEIDKRIRFRGGTYRLEAEISARQGGLEIRKQVLYGPGVGEKRRSGSYVQPDTGVLKAGNEFLLADAGDIEEGKTAAVAVQAVGVASHYFVALMLPAKGAGYGARLSSQTLEPMNGEGKPRSFITATLDARTERAEFEIFVGPKEHDRLSELGPGMERVIDYGSWMRYLALPLRSALVWMNGYVGNYGWSIVILTVLINIALVPLKHHSYVSMRKMQKLSPQIKRIQERYKKLKPTDPRQQEKNKEVMQLYKENQVSPLSGCLPMLLMIPFFFAFYRLLMVSIELRHAPFGFWIQDLSTNDPYFVLPILMGVTQIAIQKMSPQTSADPMQAKIMMLMPVMFMFILAWAPAGLVLYWFVNNLVSIGQQTITNRLIKEPPSKSGGKSGGMSNKGK